MAKSSKVLRRCHHYRVRGSIESEGNSRLLGDGALTSIVACDAIHGAVYTNYGPYHGFFLKMQKASFMPFILRLPGCLQISNGTINVVNIHICYWHKADVQTALMNVRFEGE